MQSFLYPYSNTNNDTHAFTVRGIKNYELNSPVFFEI
jgi:hypothetical protein